jgi:hypothetical protein
MTASDGIAATRHQSLFREVNERIAQLSGRGALSTSSLVLLCECADETCTESLVLTLDEYEGVRAVPTHSIVVAGHVGPHVEQLVREESDYWVVEKVGHAGSAAVRLDPRRRSDPSRR